MKLALASDHAGYPLKQHLVDYLRKHGHDIIDLGVDTDAVRVDYSDAAKKVGQAVVDRKAERGILVCGSGVGASIAANKIKGVYCAITHDAYSAAQGVEHDNMNIMALGSKIVGVAVAERLADAFISATFLTEPDRYMRRFKQVQDMEQS
ncbi:MAG: RpiB/LacA/LacB family sugar-phosphate isomerase [Anaerolineae bacterium]|nr:RpiB/LacA/LacB family sugar-phosphate isomerase [Anaerolineae bacterium]